MLLQYILLKTHICTKTYPNDIMLLFYLFWFPIFYYLFIFVFFFFGMQTIKVLQLVAKLPSIDKRCFFFFFFHNSIKVCYKEWHFKKYTKNLVIQLATFGISNKNHHYSNPSSSIVTIEFIIIK